MLDDLRNSSAFIDEDEPQNQGEKGTTYHRASRRQKDTFMGMTAQQRFILSLMVFFMVCILGIFALAISGSIYLPFL